MLRTLAFVITLALALPTAAQDGGRPIVIGSEHMIHSDILGEPRGLMIHTPLAYEQGDERYPVLYLLDSSAHFHHTTGITSFLAQNGRMPEVIVVGLRNTDRMRDLTPTAGDMPGAETSGGADAFLEFITAELAPWVDKTYRTRRVRLLVGHSLGGLFALHALQREPGFFQGLIAISPSMQWGEQELVGRIERWLETAPSVKTSVYMTVGNEGVGLLGGTHKVSGLFSEMAPPTLRWAFQHMPRETHGSVPHRSTYDGLEFVFDGWALQDPVAIYDIGGIDAVRRQCVEARRRFGYDDEPQLSDYFFPVVADLAMGQRRLTEALALAQQFGAATPPPLWDMLASRFEEQGDEENANACYLGCLQHHLLYEPARRKLLEAGVEPPPLPAAVEVPAERLAAYVGEYLLTEHSVSFSISTKDGQLFSAANGDAPEMLRAKSTTEFSANNGATFRFSIDDEGVGQLTVENFGTFPCVRVTEGDQDTDG